MSGQRAELRRAAVIIEMAILLPIFVLIALATLDTCRVLLVRQSAKLAAFECARIAIVPGVVEADVNRFCQCFMANRSIRGSALEMSTADLATLKKGDLLTVAVEVPANENSMSVSWFYRDMRFKESVTILVDR